MITIFCSFFANSLNITFFIILMVLLEPILKKYFSAVCLYRLWVVLLIGLLIPLHFESTKALFYISSPRISVEDKAVNDLEMQGDNVFYEATVKKASIQKLPSLDTGSTYHNALGIGAHFVEKSLLKKITDIVQNKYLFLCLLWILGASFLLIIKGVQYYKYIKVLKRFIMPLNQEELKEYDSQCVRKLHFNDRKGLLQFNKINVNKCSIITSPMTIGIFKPTILLPNEAYSKKDIFFILKHEFIHIQRKDSLIKLIRLIVLGLNWYNPFCYVLSRHLEDWCETSCDELVINNSTRTDRLNYSKLLLKYTAVEKKPMSIINMIGGKDNMRNRLYSIINHRKKRSSKILIALLLCIVFTTTIVSVNNNTEALASNDARTVKDESLMQSKKTNVYISDKITALPKNDKSSSSEITVKSIDTTDANSKKASTADELRESVVEYAIQAEGTPYQWGGDDLSLGVDSSGFTQAIYKKFGYDLPRTSRNQASTYEKVPLDRLQPGDLIFYASADDNIVNHVGIYIGEGKIIHAKNSRVGVTIQDMNYRKPFSAGRVISD